MIELNCPNNVALSFIIIYINLKLQIIIVMFGFYSDSAIPPDIHLRVRCRCCRGAKILSDRIFSIRQPAAS
jgi:hypothetical protein